MPSLPVENMLLKIVESEQKSFFKILYRFPEFSGNLVQDNNLIVNFVF
jgi:hypothetical protein